METSLRELNRLKEKPYTSIKDPISALTHFIGFIVSILLMPLLLIKANNDGCNMAMLIALSIYCLSMILLYGASSAYHGFNLPLKAMTILKKLDHMSIFILIAGTYTPICVKALNEKECLIFLSILYFLMAAGIIMKAYFVYCPRYVSSIIYLAMGWVAIFRLKSFYESLGMVCLSLILAGGILYSIGAIIYALKFRLNEDWGAHEIFHLFVLFASLCFYLAIFFFVA